MQQIKFSFKFIPQKSKSQFIATARKYVCVFKSLCAINCNRDIASQMLTGTRSSRVLKKKKVLQKKTQTTEYVVCNNASCR